MIATRLPDAGTSYHIETVARLWRRLSIDDFQKLFQDLKRRQATNTASIKGQQT
ncbi:hypothetical protein N7G274_003845 [Stereocaulon virgatum]|uniref:Uncharacterized protein n=1 Tax=Stereocaulon virgatum TaxID=373712 RepID=A0ABR4AJD8_9LECA